MISIVVACAILSTPVIIWGGYRLRAEYAVSKKSEEWKSESFDVGEMTTALRRCDDDCLHADTPIRLSSTEKGVYQPGGDSSADRPNNVSELGEAAIAGGVGGAAIVHQYMAIDEHIYEGIGHLAGEKFVGLGDLSTKVESYAHSDWAGLTDGNLSNLKGHIGETYSADHFEEAGIEVEWPDTGNQAGWDLLLNGHDVNVKTVSDFQSVAEHFDKYPGTPAVVPADMEGIPEDAISFDPSGSTDELLDALQNNQQELVIVDESLSVEDVTEHTEAATDALLGGGDTMDAAGGGIPLVTFALSGWRETKLLADEKTDLASSAKNIGLDVAGTGGGGFVGMKSGALIGSAFGPIGSAVGGVIGGIGGAVFGRMGTNAIKKRRFEEAADVLEKEETSLQEAFAAEQEKAERRFSLVKQKTSGKLSQSASDHKREVERQVGAVQKWRVQQERLDIDDALSHVHAALEELDAKEVYIRSTLPSTWMTWPKASRSQNALRAELDNIAQIREAVKEFGATLTKLDRDWYDRARIFNTLGSIGVAKEAVESNLRRTEKGRRALESKLRQSIESSQLALIEERAKAHRTIVEGLATIKEKMRHELKPRMSATREAASALRVEAEKLGMA